MAYAPGYTGDVFISYAHRDDEDGWVTEVKSKIASRLTADLAGEPEIWFDADRLHTGDIFKQAIHEKLSNTLILVSIVSPSYVQSEFCIERELNHFLNELGREVFQLQKVRLVEGTELPLPNSFYEVLFEEKTETPLRGKRLDSKLNSIISTLRRKMEAARQICKKIYLANPKNDNLRSACKDLGRALHKSGFAILPNQIVNERTLESKIQKWIEDAEISIHIRANPPDPLSAIQLRVAEQTQKPTIILDGAPSQREFPRIIEETKALLAKFSPRGEVYFIYDYNDSEQAGQFSSEIERYANRKVALPQPGETYHQSKLVESDGIVLFRKFAPEPWFHAHREKLQQAAALRRGRFVPEAHYVVRPGAPPQFVCSQDAPGRWLMDRVGAPEITDLRPFFDALPSPANAAAGGEP
jgi:signal recognition particle subunit SEC65